MKQPSPESPSPEVPQKKTDTVKKRVHLGIYQEPKLLTFVPSPMQLGAERVSNSYTIPTQLPGETNTNQGLVTQGCGLQKSPYNAVWFINTKYKTQVPLGFPCTLCSPTLFSTPLTSPSLGLFLSLYSFFSHALLSLGFFSLPPTSLLSLFASQRLHLSFSHWSLSPSPLASA